MTVPRTATSPAAPSLQALEPFLIIGAGPAGLTAALELVRRGVRPRVFDQDQRVGGIAQTIEHDGFRFDIGGHRFYTKVTLVRELWRSMLGADFLKRPRLSRIYYRGRLFKYPLRPLDALINLGIGKGPSILLSYLKAKLFPIRPEISFEDWVTNRFGRTLYRIFFETYTQKVWGMRGREIRAQWAAQRIKGLSLRVAIVNMLRRGRPVGGRAVTSLIDQFEYPRLGPGMMWEAFQRKVEAEGGTIELRTRVAGLEHDGARIVALTLEREGVVRREPAAQVISTMPIKDLIASMTPPAPESVQRAASRLKYRDFITVALVVEEADVFPDNWIYIHEVSVRVGRIQNFKNWSPEMVPDASKTCLGLEYFCSEGDDLWARTDAELLALGRSELATLGLADVERITGGSVVRVKKAYPVYDEGYEDAVAAVRQYLDGFSNLQLVGRNGMHKYNNQDHSMVTAILAVRNLFGERHDLWAINADDEYHEESIGTELGEWPAELREMAKTQPNVPLRVPAGRRPPAAG